MRHVNDQHAFQSKVSSQTIRCGGNGNLGKLAAYIPSLEEHDDVIAVNTPIQVEITRACGGVVHHIGMDHAARVRLTPACVADSTAIACGKSRRRPQDNQ